VERSFFDQVLDVFESMVGDVSGERHVTTHGRGIKVWYDDSTRVHYEAQMIRLDGRSALEIGFHTEHPKEPQNEAVLAAVLAAESSWRDEIGEEAEAGVFLGADKWRRISEVWEPPDPDDVDAAIEVAARLADYVTVFEPIRRQLPI
jgi:hypothetical protein